MYIEDLIYKLQLNCKINKYDTNIVISFVSQNFSYIGFTEKQSLLAIKILKRYSKNLSSVLGVDVTPFLENPVFKFSVRKSSSSKKITIVDNLAWGQAIKVEFPYDQEKIDFIRKNKENLGYAQWSSEEKAWMFSLDERNIQFLSTLIAKDNFEMDDQFLDYLEQVKTIVGSVEKHVPMLTVLDNVPKYQNISQYVPELKSKEVLSAVFEARKAGIFTWDENVSQCLDQSNLHSVVKQFISSDSTQHLDINSEENTIDCLTDIIKYTQPVLFVIPGGSELEKTRMVYNFLTSKGYYNDEMSVMFRLSNNDNKEFNDFVKNCGLNNPITEKTKFVFISIKLPKPIIKSKIKFNSIISLGRSNVHYTIREFFKNKENLIYYCEENKQREFNFGDL